MSHAVRPDITGHHEQTLEDNRSTEAENQQADQSSSGCSVDTTLKSLHSDHRQVELMHNCIVGVLSGTLPHLNCYPTVTYSLLLQCQLMTVSEMCSLLAGYKHDA